MFAFLFFTLCRKFSLISFGCLHFFTLSEIFFNSMVLVFVCNFLTLCRKFSEEGSQPLSQDRLQLADRVSASAVSIQHFLGPMGLRKFMLFVVHVTFGQRTPQKGGGINVRRAVLLRNILLTIYSDGNQQDEFVCIASTTKTWANPGKRRSR